MPRLAAVGEPQKLLDSWTKLHRLVSGIGKREDPYDFIDSYRSSQQNKRILDSCGVDFTTFQFEGRAHMMVAVLSSR